MAELAVRRRGRSVSAGQSGSVSVAKARKDGPISHFAQRHETELREHRKLAGAPGFEPGNAGIKSPNHRRQASTSRSSVEEGIQQRIKAVATPRAAYNAH